MSGSPPPAVSAAAQAATRPVPPSILPDPPPNQSGPLARALEISRCHAEAVLQQEQRGEVVLGPTERESLCRRARGILPDSLSGRCAELLLCSELQPRRVAASAERVIAAMDEVEAQLDTATALAFGLLCASGVHQPESLLAYARKLDAIFSRITATPAIVAALHLQPEVRAEAPFEAQLGLLLEVQTALWRLKPNRVSGDFLLTQVIDSYTDNRPGAGNSLGLALLDSYIIGRLGLPVRCLTEHDVLRLEIELAGRRVYWEVLEPMPVSLVPVAPGHRMGRTDLIALYYASLGTYCFVQGRWDKAMEMYRRSLALKPDAAATHVSVAMCLLRREQPSEAIRVLHRAQDLAPNAPEAHYHEGNAYAVMKHWPKAAGAYKRALALRPEYAEAANNLGLAYANMDAPDKAELAFNQARQARPDYYQAIFNLGNLLLDRRRFDEAIDAYREVCRLEPNYAAARYNMGRAYYEMHDLDGSINCYRKAVQLNPRHFGAWHNLGIAYRDKGLVDKAVEALERAVTLNPCLMR